MVSDPRDFLSYGVICGAEYHPELSPVNRRGMSAYGCCALVDRVLLGRTARFLGRRSVELSRRLTVRRITGRQLWQHGRAGLVSLDRRSSAAAAAAATSAARSRQACCCRGPTRAPRSTPSFTVSTPTSPARYSGTT